MTITFTEEYRTRDADKEKWGAGQWIDEPDKAVWIDAPTGLDCMIHRNRVGALCGYVGVSEGHPWFGRAYNGSSHLCDDTCEDYCEKRNEGSPEATARVHGGLTYSDFCYPTTDPSEGICHIPQAGRPDKVWWFGFDCAHSGDKCPSMPDFGFGGESYKNFAYVIAEIRTLADQLASMQAS